MSGSKPVAVFLLLTLLIFKVTGLCAQTIQGFTPTNGGVGTTVTITGVGFNTSLAGNIVYFGAAKAVVTSANVNVLTVTVPAGATYQPITAVNTSTGTQGISKQPFDVTYNPTKSSIKPADFDSKVDFTTGSSPLSLSVCDVDGDGKPDIITSNGDKTISILKNTGAGGSITPASFAAGISLATGDNPLSITTGDINGDGKPDIVVVNSNTTVSVYKNLSTVGNISFAPKVDFVITNPTALKSVVISDIDGDLLPDLVFCSGGDVNILRNTSTGGNITFAAQKNFPANTSPTSYITVGDIDGDGKPDLAVTNKGNKTFSIFHNKSTAGTIKFDVRLDYSNIGEPDYVAESILLTDVDGDGKPEVLTVYTNYVNTALPSFVLISRYKGPGFANANFLYDSKFNSNHGYAQVRVADINGDGRPDIITLDPAGQVAIQSNISIPGSIAFLNAENLAAGSSPTAFEIADVNGDGKPDIITAHSPNAVAVIGNNPILNTPAITSFAPATVSAATTITIKGKNFTGATAVSFGNTPVTFTVISATEISAQVTTGTTGKVRVTTPLGIAERDGFKYVNPPNINYQTPQSYIINENITPLTPNNTGGAIPQTIYGETTVFAGSGGIGDNDGTGTAAQFKNPYGLTMDLEGNMYVTEVGASRLRKITPAGVVTTIAPDAVPGTLYGTGPARKFGNLHGVVVDADGNVYVADYINALIRKITPDGTVTTLAGNINAGTQDGQGTAAGILRPSGMVIDGNGNIYFTDEHNRIRMVSPTGYVSTFVGSGLAKTQDGQYTTASFNVPVGLVIDKQGNLYVTEQTGRVIRKVTPNGVVTTFAGNGSYGYADGTGTAAVFGFLNGISIDASGNLLVTDQGYIRKITPAGVVATVAGGGPAGAITGTGKDVNFTQPTGVIVGPDGNLYVAENDNRIKKVIATGYTIDKTLPAGLVFDPKTGIISGTPTVLSPPTDYTITGYNKDGSSIKVVNIEVKQKDVVVPVLPPKISYLTPQVYEVNKTIAVLSPTNTGGPVGKGNFSTVTTLAGNLTAGAVNGLGSAASFNRPEGLTVDHSGNIYVADAANSLIRKITPGGNVSTFAGSGIASFADGTGTGAFFNNPADVVVDAAGNVYVADANNHRIRKITPAGVETTIAGNSTVGNADGTGTA
ncbi:MAG: FG-GAP-like repeat-containing protein, partial [Mucilaginibacter sp.]